MITHHELWEMYRKHAEVYYRSPDGTATGEMNNIDHAYRHVLHLFADDDCSSFSPRKLKDARESMIIAGLARNTINSRINRIKRVIRWAVSMEIVPPSLLTGLESLASLLAGRSTAHESPPITPAPWPDVKTVIDHVDDPQRAIIEVLWWTGMRVSEALTMKPTEIDRSGPVWLYTPSHHKNQHRGLTRVIALGPRAQAPVMRGLADIAMLLYPDNNTAVFESRSGNLVTTNGLRRVVQRACHRCNITPWTPLQLRHSAATRLRKEIGIEAARVVLGHTSAVTTEIYAELDQERARELMLRFG